jgi:hypothetical protein
MNKHLGYGAHRTLEDHLVVGVAPAGEHAWRLAARHRVGTGEDWPADVLRDLGRAQGRCGWLMPEEDVTCTQTPLPRLKQAEMVRAVTGWVARQEGGTPDDWTVSWRAFDSPTGKADSQQVAMVYAHGEDVEGQLAAAGRLGMSPGLLLPPSLILDQFFRAASPESASLDVWNLVFVGGRTNVLCVANGDGLLLTRPLPSDLAGGGDRREYLERLTTEVDRSIFFARQTAGSPQVDGVFVCGEPQLAEELVASLRESTSVSCQAWPITDVIDCGDHVPDSDEQILLMAAALATRTVDFNLAPAWRRGWPNETLRRRLVIGAATAAAAIIPILIVGGLVTSRVQRHYLAESQERLEEATERAVAAADVYNRQRLLQAREVYLEQHTRSRLDLENLLLRLAQATPPEVLFRDLQLVDRDDGMVLNLSGESVAPTLGEAQRGFMTFQGAIQDLDGLHPIGEPRHLQVAEVDENGRIRQTVVFNLECRLTLPVGGRKG